MARIKIDLPPTFIASIIIPVRITDINYGNHLGNDSLVSILHEARVQWLAQAGYTELDIEGIGVIMSDLAVEYKKEAFYGDQLTIKIAVGEITSVSFEIYYHIINQDNKEIAKAKTGMVCYDYGKKKVAAIPPAFLSIIK
jgi:acyl-CoA thioester hydrolase